MNSSKVNIKPKLSKKVLVIGITGISRSGKSTLAKKLAEFYNTKNVLYMDDFLVHKGILKTDNKWKNGTSPIADWEDPNCYDIDKFIYKLEELKSNRNYTTNLNNNIIIVEGFLLFSRKDVFDLVDYKIYIDIDKEVARERRKSTKFYHSDYYFDEYIWKGFHNNLKQFNRLDKNTMVLPCDDTNFIKAIEAIDKFM